MRFLIGSVQADGQGLDTGLHQLGCYLSGDKSTVCPHHGGQTCVPRVTHKVKNVRTHQRFAPVQYDETCSSFGDLADQINCLASAVFNSPG